MVTISNYKRIPLASFFLFLLGMPAAQAQLLVDPAMTTAIGSGMELNAANRAPTDVGMVMERLKRQGYTNIQPNPSNTREMMASAPGGIKVKLQIDPMTGQVISAVPQP